ncbi:hypothetical protein QTP88_009346 [Uroleucon formosanum]
MKSSGTDRPDEQRLSRNHYRLPLKLHATTLLLLLLHFVSSTSALRNEVYRETYTDDAVILEVKSIFNAKNRNNCPLPVFFVDIRQQDNNDDIHDITSLVNTKVKIEKPIKKRRGPPQCHNCQDYGYTKNYCNHEARCVKCGKNHLTIECSEDQNSPAKCALCANDHTANFKGYPVYKAAFKKTDHPAKGSDSNTYQKTKSYAEATKNHQNLHAELKITDIFSSFISNLNTLITPLISLLSSVLKALTTNSIP